MATASHPITIDTIVDWMANVWWIWIIGSVFLGGFIESIRDFIIETISEIANIRHQHRKAELKAQKKAARLAQPALLAPGPCQHLHVTSVIDDNDKLVAWLCKNEECSEQLPASWAVRKKDLQ